MMRLNGVYPAYDDSILLVGLQNKILPNINYTSQKIPGQQGIIGISKTHDERIIIPTYQLNGKTEEKNMELTAALALWAESNTAGQIVLDKMPDRFYMGILTNTTDPEYTEDWPEVTLTFTCANPYAYSIAQHSAAVGDVIDYQGTVAVYPMIVFTPESDLTSAQWSDGTRTLIINDADYTMQAGHKIVIDCANRLITDNGVSIMAYKTLLSDWLYMARGINTITGPGGTVKWRNVYL